MTSLPYITSPGNIDKALDAIKKASVPDLVSQDFVKTILKIPGGSGSQMTSYLKKIGFASSDGKPTDAYKKFRNPSSSGQAIAACLKKAYSPLYTRNTYMHELSDDELIGLVVEETGQAHDSNPVKLIVSCIQRLKNFADFTEDSDKTFIDNESIETDKNVYDAPTIPSKPAQQSIGMNLGYTINLNLPATSDPAVFDAIFKSLKENLLSQEDA